MGSLGGCGLCQDRQPERRRESRWHTPLAALAPAVVVPPRPARVCIARGTTPRAAFVRPRSRLGPAPLRPDPRRARVFQLPTWEETQTTGTIANPLASETRLCPLPGCRRAVPSSEPGGETAPGVLRKEFRMSEAMPGIGYWRMSGDKQERSIPQQRAEMLPKAKLAGIEMVREFQDEAKSGGTMKKR